MNLIYHIYKKEYERGKEYLVIPQTSVNDNAVGKENLGGKQGWLKDDNGNILVPVSETKGYVNFKAPVVYEQER